MAGLIIFVPQGIRLRDTEVEPVARCGPALARSWSTRLPAVLLLMQVSLLSVMVDSLWSGRWREAAR